MNRMGPWALFGNQHRRELNMSMNAKEKTASVNAVKDRATGIEIGYVIAPDGLRMTYSEYIDMVLSER